MAGSFTRDLHASLPTAGADASEVATVKRNDGVNSTMLRKIKTVERAEHVFVDSRRCVQDGEQVTVLRREGDFAYVRTDDGVEGYLRGAYCAAVASLPGAGATNASEVATVKR